jgi:hypothetical protein
MPISQGKVTLSSTQPAKVAGAIACKSFALSAASNNSAAITVAGSEGSTTGFPLEPGESVSLSEAGGLEDLFLRGTSGDVLYWLASA